ncbi:MAG: hypothetical protein JW807_16665 [Spirochaetes bacterium]|nr:hypothetical protein [Spirochaetota bacterium]
MNEKIEQAAVWLEQQLTGMIYGEACVRVVVHNGKARIERQVVHRDEMNRLG